MWGFGPVGKVETPLPPVWERITEEVGGNWQDEINQGGEEVTGGMGSKPSLVALPGAGRGSREMSPALAWINQSVEFAFGRD